MLRAILAGLACLWLPACAAGGEAAGADPAGGRRIVSLDYCADQYVLRFARRGEILALSPDAAKPFSYLRAAAKGVPTVRPRTAEVLALRPTLVVRSYGGGPGVEGFLESAGVKVLQLGYPETLADVRAEVVRVGTELGAPGEAEALAGEMDRRMATLAARRATSAQALYMTPTGVTAGEGTLIAELFAAAGLANFERRTGWHPLPLERLAYARPDLVAAAFFDTATGQVDSWSAARHPIAQAQLEGRPVAAIEGAWTACGAWFLLDAIEAMADAADRAGAL